MHVLYLDESGSAETLCRIHPESTPVFVLGGVCVDIKEQRGLVWDFLKLKEEFNPHLQKKQLSDAIAYEMKGSSLRSDIRSTSRRRRRRAISFIHQLIELLNDHKAKVVAKVNMKNVDETHNDVSQYSACNRWVLNSFDKYLAEYKTEGIAILDSRTKVKNSPLVSNVVTAMYRRGGGDFSRLLDAPTFGHSDVHIGIQIADHIVSSLIFPMACYAFCSKYAWNTHVNTNYRILIENFGPALQELQMRYISKPSLERRGGIYCTGTNDVIKSSRLFRLQEDINPPLFD